MTATQTATPLRSALERLARKWTLTLPGGAPNRYHFFGDELTALLGTADDAGLEIAAEALADNWGNAGTGVPEGHGYVRGYFAFDVKQTVKASRDQ
ncbi:hypothetical protein GCM10023063_18000 [Arthrobacter methylotrophus]|uniref:Uncharacterized protein n=1 Tax=Arthrobacter methylotrophus TaxID=121291 RepID=A0ABV5UNV8_9MICC